jgi:hypothetical protein
LDRRPFHAPVSVLGNAMLASNSSKVVATTQSPFLYGVMEERNHV